MILESDNDIYKLLKLLCYVYQSIGVLNTIITRTTDWKLVDYIIDCEVAITTIEDAPRGTYLYCNSTSILFTT